MNFANLRAESEGEFRPSIELYDVDSRKKLFDLLNQIAGDTKDGVKPLLHFEMHGRKEGIVLSDDSLVEWTELKEPIRKINILCGNNLFVGLATCYGAYFLKMYRVWEPCPFYGYIGADTTVGVLDVEVSFSNFYRVLIEARNFFDAIKALQESVEVNKQIYNYVNCEAFFEMLIKDFWVTPNEGLSARVKMINQITEYYFKKNPRPAISKRQLRKIIDRRVTTGHDEAKLLSEMKEVFLHKRTDVKFLTQ